MDGKIIIAALLLLAIPTAFASITISPETLSLNLTGGEQLSQTYTIKNNGSTTTDIDLKITATNTTGDLNGFNYTLSENNFSLASGGEKTITVTFTADQAIASEPYSITLEAHTKIDVAQPETPTQPFTGTYHTIIRPLLPKPTEPDEPEPTEPEPTEPKPVEPKPVEPKPVEPKPVEPNLILSSSALFALTPLSLSTYIAGLVLLIGLAILLLLARRKKKPKGGIKPMNKKLLAIFAVFALFATAGTATLLDYYGQATVDVNIKQAISLSGDESPQAEVVACDVVTRSHTAENESVAEIPVTISTTVSADFTPNSSAEANTVHKGTLELTKKVVDFEATHWAIVPDTEITVEYVMIGDTFDAVVTSGAETGYEIIYYKDNSDRFSSPAQAIQLADVGSELPYTDDKNLEDYDYCDGEEAYTTCHGAKLWYVPSDAILAGNELDWSRANEFYFEKEELIQYNTTGAITMFPSEVLDFSTETTFDCASIAGTYNILTQVATVIP